MMDLPELFDCDGYPTEEALEKVRDWCVDDNGLSFEVNVNHWMLWCQSLWKYPDDFKQIDVKRRNGHGTPIQSVWKVNTAGWSGNEDVLKAMMGNTVFWDTIWLASYRGGLYKFKDLSGEYP